MNREVQGRLIQLADSEQWSPYCRGIDDTMLRLMTAAVLENSKRLRGDLPSIMPSDLPDSAFYSFVTAIMRGIRTHTFVSFQPAMTEASPVFFLQRMEDTHGSDIPEINLQLVSRPVLADRSVSAIAEWSMGAELAMRRMERDSSMAVELLSGLARELSTSIDNAVMRELWGGTETEFEYKSTEIQGLIDAAINGTSRVMNNTGRAMVDSIIVSQFIYQNMLRRAGREIFQPHADIYDGAGLRKVGRLLNRWDVYEYPYFSDDNVLFCAKGASWMDSGYIFVPYAVVSRSAMDTSSFSQRISFSLLHGSSMVNPMNFCKCRFTLKEPEVVVQEAERPQYFRKLTINYD